MYGLRTVKILIEQILLCHVKVWVLCAVVYVFGKSLFWYFKC
jgi:hypothetical protein